MQASVKTLPFGVFLRSWPKPDKYMITDLEAPLLGFMAEYELRNKKASSPDAYIRERNMINDLQGQ